MKKEIVNGIVNKTYICLIRKKKDCSGIGDFTPISLVSSIYKIIAKALIARLKGVLEDCISDCQFAFVGERQILDAGRRNKRGGLLNWISKKLMIELIGDFWGRC